MHVKDLFQSPLINRVDYYLLLGVCLFLPLSLSISYIFLIPSILIWLVRIYQGKSEAIPGALIPFIAPFVIWWMLMLINSFFGLNPGHSIIAIMGLGFSALLIPFISSCSSPNARFKIIAALFFGQSISALHSILESFSPSTFKQTFVGTVSESGQLAIVIPIAVGLAFIPNRSSHKLRNYSFATLNLFLLLLLAFYRNIEKFHLPIALIAGSIFVSTIFCVFFCLRERKEAFLTFLYTIALPLLLAALLANLKRGPWIGVFFGLAFFLGKVKPKFLLPLFAFCLTIFATVPSIRDRLEESYNHFVIRGGRLIMWEVGSELVAKYPLGIGFGNSKFMRELDPSIPEVHRHFHNNFLNVTVETGWPGLLLYCWWILGSIYLALKRSSSASPQKRIALLAISTSLLSWQIAGLVEYSFGDSEVLFTAFVILGILGSLIIDKTKSDLLNQPIE